MSEIISIACHKGGVGKTTTTSSVGGILAATGKKVLLIDIDPQMNLTKTYTDGEFSRTIYEAFKERKNLPVYSIRENLDLVPSCPDATGIDSEFASVLCREKILMDLISPVKERYDFIFIDCPAKMGIATANAFAASNSVLIPISCDAYSADGFLQLYDIVNIVRSALNPGLYIKGILITKYRRSRVVDQLVAESLAENWSEGLLETKIRENTAIVKAPFSKMDIYEYDKNCIGSKDYCKLVKEIFDIEI